MNDQEKGAAFLDAFIQKVNADHDDVICVSRNNACWMRDEIERLRKFEFSKTWPPASMCNVVYPHDMGERLVCQKALGHGGGHWAKGKHAEYGWPGKKLR